MGELIEEALDDENIVDDADAAPERGRDSWWLDPNIVDTDVREGIRRFGRPLDRIVVDAVIEQRRDIARADRRTADTVLPGYWLAIRVEPSRQAVIVVRPVHVVLDVFLAAPDDFHRSIHL